MAEEEESTTPQRRRRASAASGGNSNAKSSDSSDDRSARPRQRGDRDSGMKPAQAAREAMRQLQELTQREVEGVTGIEKGDDGGWTVTVEVVESRRIPDTADVLAEYEVGVDAKGELTTYSRQSRYLRGRTSRD